MSHWTAAAIIVQYPRTKSCIVIKPNISGIAPFFIVNHIAGALAFYRDRLGFDITLKGASLMTSSLALSSVARR
jgi:hypothetical protein